MINTASIPAVELTLWALGAFSATTWTLILIKAAQHVRLSRGNARYARSFWSAANLLDAAEISNDSPLARVASSGFSALKTASASLDADLEHSWDRHELLERNLRQQIQRERRGLESGLAVLASVGSTAPFVGLFGTVWGIMSAMSDISRLGNASIDVVAGPIGEALIATGIGIAAAIPAVLAYNYFVRRLKSVIADLEDFGHDFLNLAQRASYRVERAGRPADGRSDPRHKAAHSRDTDWTPQPVLIGGKAAI